MKAQPDRVPIFLLVIILMGSLVACTANKEAAPSVTATVERTALVSATIPPAPATSTPDAIPPTATATENAVPLASDTTTDALPEAMVLHETDEFSILLPEGMEVLNPTDRLSQDTLEQFGDNNPALASMMPSEQDLERIQLYAVETDIPEESVGGFNFILFRIPISEFGEIELQRDVIDPFVNAYGESGVTVLEVDTDMEIADTSAARIAYELPMNLPSGGTITGGILQYLVPGSSGVGT